jgi:serine protease Do
MRCVDWKQKSTRLQAARPPRSNHNSAQEAMPKKKPIYLFASLAFLAAAAGAQITENGLPIDQLSAQERFERRLTQEVQVVASATPAVVFIETDTKTRVLDFWGRVRSRSGRSSGSGVVLSGSGFIVTNYHVVKGATSIRVSFEKSIDDQVYEADLLSFVEEEDLALLKIRGARKEFATVPLGTSSDLMIGERVLAIGNPYGITHTVSVGIISGLHRGIKINTPGSGLSLQFDDLIQTDASINPGNSGGPLLNINGELIGINNAVNTEAENIGFAIPIDRVREVLEQQLISPDRYSAWLGFETSQDDDVVVRDLVSGSPAALAGLRDGDRLLALGDEAIDSLESYRLARVGLRPGHLTSIRVQRGESTISLPVQAWDKTDGLIYERLGVRVEPVAIGRNGRFLRLSALSSGGPAEAIGLHRGDLINALRKSRGRLTQAYTFRYRIDLAQFLDSIDPAAEIEIEIRREGELYRGKLQLK